MEKSTRESKITLREGINVNVCRKEGFNGRTGASLGGEQRGAGAPHEEDVRTGEKKLHLTVTDLSEWFRLVSSIGSYLRMGNVASACSLTCGGVNHLKWFHSLSFC